jgi:hypothetical protein
VSGFCVFVFVVFFTLHVLLTSCNRHATKRSGHIEIAFGLLKNRFKILVERIDGKPDNVWRKIRAAFYLHNFIQRRSRRPEEEAEVLADIERAAAAGAAAGGAGAGGVVGGGAVAGGGAAAARAEAREWRDALTAQLVADNPRFL